MQSFVSLKHGRPPAVSLETLPVDPPATVHDDCITHSGISDVQTGDTPSPMHFFNAIVQLAHIAETMLACMLKDAPWCLPGHVARPSRELDPIRLNIQFGLVTEQEGKLSVWLSSLPAHLQFSAVTEDEKVKRQQKMLRVRYLHIRLMSHRPNLVSVIQIGRDSEKSVLDDNFLKTVIMASVRQCADCACDIIAVLKDITGPEDMGAWWYHLPCAWALLLSPYLSGEVLLTNNPDLYTALGTLFSVQRQEILSPYIDFGAAGAAIDMALDYLDQLGDISPVVAKCRKYFHSVKAWSEKRSPRANSAARCDDVQVATSSGPTNIRGDIGGGIDTQTGPDFTDYLADNLGNFVCDPTSDLFLDSLPPDFFNV